MTGETEGHVLWICLPQGHLPTVHSCYTHRSSALPEGPLGGLPSLSLTTEGSSIHLGGRVAKPLVSPLMAVPPLLYIDQPVRQCVCEETQPIECKTLAQFKYTHDVGVVCDHCRIHRLAASKPLLGGTEKRPMNAFPRCHLSSHKQLLVNSSLPIIIIIIIQEKINVAFSPK